MKVCLIVLNFNDYKTTSKFIEKVDSYKNINKIIIIDNNSTDNSYEILKNYVNNKVEIIKSNFNKGYAYGNNFGVKYSEKYNCDFTVICNPDVMFEENVISNLTNTLMKNKELALISCKIEEPENKKAISAFKCPSYCDLLISSFILGAKIINQKTIYKNSELNEKLNYVEVVPGCFFIIKTDIMKKINYMDEETFLYCEEIILSKKLKDFGYKIGLNNEISILHCHGKTINKNIKSKLKKFKILNESKYIYAKKYLKINKLGLLFLRLTFTLGILERKIVYYFLNKK